MKSYNGVIAALLLGVLMIALWLVQEPLDFKINARTTLMDNPPAGQQIMTLPEDGNAYFTSIFVPANWQANPKSRALVAWFDTDTQLRSLKTQTHFKVFAANDLMARRYHNVVTELPCVMIQKPDGTRVYHAQGDSLPASATALAADIQGNLYMKCPLKKPEPEPEPAVVNGPPSLTGTAWEPNLILAALSLVAGLAFGAGTSYYEQYYGNSEVI